MPSGGTSTLFPTSSGSKDTMIAMVWCGSTPRTLKLAFRSSCRGSWRYVSPVEFDSPARAVLIFFCFVVVSCCRVASKQYVVLLTHAVSAKWSCVSGRAQSAAKR